MPEPTKIDWRGLWAIFWRVLILGPIFGILGIGLLALIMGAFVVPPIYAAAAFYTGDWLFGIAALIPWFVVLRFRGPILRWTLDGIQYASI